MGLLAFILLSMLTPPQIFTRVWSGIASIPNKHMKIVPIIIITAALSNHADTWTSPVISAAGELDLMDVPLALPKFDGNLGTLQSVRVVISGVAVTNSVSVRLSGSLPTGYSIDMAETLYISSPITETAVYQFTDHFAGTISPWQTVQNQHILLGVQSTFWSDQAIALNAFTGTGSYVFTLNTVSSASANLPANCGATYTSTAGVTAQVTYTYAPSCRDEDEDGDDCDGDKKHKKHKKK